MGPRYPIYIPSKGRYRHCLTADVFVRDRVPFHLVVEEPERDHYAARYGEDRLLVLPFQDQGVTAARNWIKDHAIAAGHDRHWQFDDNVRDFYRVFRGRRLYCRAGLALTVVEDFTDRYTNVAVSGLNYVMFAPVESQSLPPFQVNCHVYSCSLINNRTPHRWRLRYNEDADYCLQVLADGWCTILINAFLAQKLWTMRVPGGNTDDLYQGDGRLQMARALERAWPGVVHVNRRYGRPQHVVAFSWRRFDTPLERRPGLNPTEGPDERGMILRQVAPIRNRRLRRFYEDYTAGD